MLELWVNVSIRSIGNIVFEIYDTSEIILPGDCATYDLNVIKNYEAINLVFTMPGAPAKPEEIDPQYMEARPLDSF